jgi:phosphoribosylamine--glycine ligase
MNILVIGSGGREHALIWALNRSATVETIYAAPGNGGILEVAVQAALAISKPDEIIRFCEEKEIGLVIIGPEAPLVDGIADPLRAAGIPVFGPSKNAARLEGSKEYTKYICDKYNIPTAAYKACSDVDEAVAYIKEKGAPIVVKADGLAAGKGVVMAQTEAEAIEAVEDMLEGNRFGDAGSRVVIEELLEGEEISFFALCDGETAIAFGSAQDHKRVGEGDTGPNTGGMGTYSPAPVMTDLLHKQIMEEAILPTVAAMKSEGCPYQGVLFAGFMVTDEGAKLLEFNVRFGDPETQVLMMRLKSDLLPLLLASAQGELAGKSIEVYDRAAVCVVMAANGYPDNYDKGTEIRNLAQVEQLPNVVTFHAGTKRGTDDAIYANGGRVLGVTAIGADVRQAQKRAYEAVDQIDWPEGFCRRDIAWRALG